MPLNARDAAYLWDIIEAARSVRQFVTGVSVEQYLADRKLQMAIERAIEIIGEAAGRVSEPVRNEHSEIPWRQIVAQRNVIAHEYGEIKQERLWLVATRDIPKLVAQLEPLLPAEPTQPNTP